MNYFTENDEWGGQHFVADDIEDALEKNPRAVPTMGELLRFGQTIILSEWRMVAYYPPDQSLYLIDSQDYHSEGEVFTLHNVRRLARID